MTGFFLLKGWGKTAPYNWAQSAINCFFGIPFFNQKNDLYDQ
jgi:hypothetical protein